jgi:flagellar basal body P-ring formation protein FlgA
MRRLFLIAASLFLGTTGPGSASESSVATAAAHPAAEHPWLATLSALLVDRYHAEGELRLAWQRPPAASAPHEADIELVNAPAVLASQILVLVRAREPSGRVTDHSLLLRAELFREGWQLRQPAVIGAPLVPAALESRRIDALRERDAFVLDATSASADTPLSELDFARAVPAGRVLVWRDVVRRPLVRRGQPVDVVASDGALTVSLRAVALHDAARGESVRVRNPDSKREFVAVVTADSRASVRF